MRVPTLETERLLIREFAMDDLPALHQILDVELADSPVGSETRESIDARRRWLEWTILSYEQLGLMYQPPSVDRAVVRKADGRLIGACGFVTYLMPFSQIPGFGDGVRDLATAEFGLYYALSPSVHRQGYATEAAQALIDYGFSEFKLRHVVATTSYDNAASIGVMRKLGMRVEHNPYPDPPWLEVVGVIRHPALQ
jgi:[ribosomal protein S5]-alanine N-acetyltransferase